MKKEKILILTLGTGSIVGNTKGMNEQEKEDKIKAAIETKKYSYRKIKYQINGEETQETEFVAEPLITMYHPDKVFIIGTVKSQWMAFYTKFGDGNKDTIRELYRMESENGIDTSMQDLQVLSRKITEIYRNGLVQEPFHGQMDVTVILTRYGVNDTQLLENYQLIREIGESLKIDTSYDVAFDITHSFRSLPIYNLVILYYLRHVLQYDITISHVYYGNLDISSENGGAASVIDLKELIDVLELTTGINEFKNTGNAITLFSEIPEEEPLREALQKFDWATQVNEFDDIEKTLDELLKLTKGKNDQQNQKYADLYAMVREVLIRKFFKENGISEEAATDLQQISIEEKRFAIAKWYLRQNRYGQAIVTAMEALRSYLVPMYLEMKGIAVTVKNCETENYRREAIDRLNRIAKYYKVFPKKAGDTERLYMELDECRIKATPIRNRFAHNLNVKYSENHPAKNIDEEKRMIEDFIQKLGELRKRLKKDRETLKKVYHEPLKLEEVKSKLELQDNIRIIISQEYDDEFRRYVKSNNSKGRRYKVYYLDTELRKLLKVQTVSQSAVFLAKYIAGLNIPNENLQIILYGFTSRKWLSYKIMLESFDITNIIIYANEFQGQLAESEFKVEKEDYENYEFDVRLNNYLASEATIENGTIRKKGLKKI